MTRDPNQRVRTTSGTMTVAELVARVSLAEPRIVVMREVPHGTADSFEILLETAKKMGSQFDRWAMVVDLSEVTERPRGRYLEMIRREALSKLGRPGQPAYMATIQPGNAFMRTVLGFVLGRMSSNITVHATRETAIAACRDAVGGSHEHPHHVK